MKKMKEEIVKMMVGMSGRYSYHTIFQDWVAVMAIAIQNNCVLWHDKIWQEREEHYKNIMSKYEREERIKFIQMFEMLTNQFEEGKITDVLGEIYMSQNSGNGRLGQFFTPFHLSELNARLIIEDQLEGYDGEKKIEVNEPSTGGGGMLIALCKILKERGIDYQRKLEITAQDLDWNGVYMTYVQLSLLGAKATVVQGDTLCEPYVQGVTPEYRILRTPMKTGALI